MSRLRWVNDPHIEIVLSILTPFIAFRPAEHLGGSGRAGNRDDGTPRQLVWTRAHQATTRIQGVFFWDFFIYVIEGMVFLIWKPATGGMQGHLEREGAARDFCSGVRL
jgi:CPA1 family monovalent cation:H+ antiporter